MERVRRISYSTIRGGENICAALFFMGVFLGTLIFNFHGGKYADWFLISMNVTQSGYQQIKLSYSRLFWYILEHRGKRFALLWFGEMTQFRKKIRWGFAFYYGISIGLIESALSHKSGILGVIEFFLLFFPHYLIYGYNWKFLQDFRIKERKIVWTILEITLFLLGIITEVFVNTAILRKYYEMISFVR